VLEIDIRIAQMNRFGNAQPGRGHQAEQGFVGVLLTLTEN
jgi:hypothetical protein